MFRRSLTGWLVRSRRAVKRARQMFAMLAYHRLHFIQQLAFLLALGPLVAFLHLTEVFASFFNTHVVTCSVAFLDNTFF